MFEGFKKWLIFWIPQKISQKSPLGDFWRVLGINDTQIPVLRKKCCFWHFYEFLSLTLRFLKNLQKSNFLLFWLEVRDTLGPFLVFLTKNGQKVTFWTSFWRSKKSLFGSKCPIFLRFLGFLAKTGFLPKKGVRTPSGTPPGGTGPPKTPKNTIFWGFWQFWQFLSIAYRWSMAKNRTFQNRKFW